MELEKLLVQALSKNSSDVFLIPGSPATAKVKGQFVPLTENILLPKDIQDLAEQTYRLADHRTMETLHNEGDDDFSFSLERVCRFRCNVFRQRGTLSVIYRVVTFGIPDPKQMHIPELVLKAADLHNGMVLVTGPAGSGKSTTLACIIDRINNTSAGHIITIEDPIEYLHPHRKSLVTQREVRNDTSSFTRALRAALRQAPDVIMVGEMRDYESMQFAITAAETGHMVLSSLHTVGAAKTIDRIVDAFPVNQQQQVRLQLSMVLRAVICQRLVPTRSNEQIPVFEVMQVNSAVQNLIREGKTHQLDNVIYSGVSDGTMLSMDNELVRLYKQGEITRDNAIVYASNQEAIRRRI